MTLFSVVLDNEVFHWISITVGGDAVIPDGLGHAVGCSMRVFYADYELNGSQGP